MRIKRLAPTTPEACLICLRRRESTCTPAHEKAQHRAPRRPARVAAPARIAAALEADVCQDEQDRRNHGQALM